MNPIHNFSIKLNSGEYSECREIINSVDISKLGKHTNGFYSLLIRYYIKTDNLIEVHKIFASNDNLMKRDYILYCITIYNSNRVASIKIFFDNVVTKEKLLPSDINMLIDNKCFDLLSILNGYYVTCNKKSMCIDTSILSRNNHITAKDAIIDYYKKLIPDDSYENFISKIKYVDVILDGGNIYHYCKRNNFKNLEKVFMMARSNFRNPLIIIHQRHFKKSNPESCAFYKKFSANIFITPYNIYDDYYLILGMIINDIPIVTNDYFRDHIFDMFKHFDSKNNHIRNYISEMLLKFTEKSINKMNTYSKCIHLIDSDVYIPTKDGFYIMSN